MVSTAKNISVAILLLLSFTLSFTLHADGFFSNKTAFANDTSFLPVTQAYQLNITEAPTTTLQWQITEGYYLYGHQFKVKFTDNNGNIIPLTLQRKPGVIKDDPYFGSVEVYYKEASIEVIPNPPLTKPIKGTITVTSQGCADAGLCYPPYTQSLPLTLQPALPLAQTTLTNQKANQTPAIPQQGSITLLTAALFAFLGGVILNLMPCVFPILSLKVLAFAGKDPLSSRLKTHGLVYSAGVIISFVITALLLHALKTGGSLVGWGFQLQNSRFVMILAVLFFILGLSLAGLLSLNSRWASIGNHLTQRGGLQGSFFTGVLAVMVASPCTAPFMGAAMAYALTQPLTYNLFIFGVLGLGMASPFLLISFIPSLSRKLPKPGAWMETLKQLFAFPLLLTSIWLLWVLGNQTSMTTVAITLCLFTLLAFAAWLKSKISKPFITTLLLPLVLSIAMIGLVTSPSLHSSQQEQSLPAENTWSYERLQKLLAQGKPVFVNVTADWCVTCLANEQTTLQSQLVKSTFKEKGISYLKADWTRSNPAITAFLTEHGRAGVPLYLYFPPKVVTGKTNDVIKPIMLPQILRPSIVLAVINQ